MSPCLQLKQSAWKTVLVDAESVVVQRNVEEPRLVGHETKTDDFVCL